MHISDTFEFSLNLTDAHVEPAARKLYDLCSRGNPRGYLPFEDVTEGEYNDYMIMAHWSVEGFLRGLPDCEAK